MLQTWHCTIHYDEYISILFDSCLIVKRYTIIIYDEMKRFHCRTAFLPCEILHVRLKMVPTPQQLIISPVKFLDGTFAVKALYIALHG
jgi:hypothetical protein